MVENQSRLVCLLLSPQESGLLRALLAEHTDDRAARLLLARLDAAEQAHLLPLLSRALGHVGITTRPVEN
jgi:hypothetical protein